MKPTNHFLRILFFGMQGPFSLPPFRALMEHGWRPAALITPPPPGAQFPFRKLHFPFPSESAQPGNLYHLAARHEVPIYEIGRLKHPDALDLLHTAAPDIIIVACFNRLLPRAWLDAPRLGCINLHPSLLPAYRGPTPLEDQLTNGESHTGITLHFMDEGADTGDIIVQEALPVPEIVTLDDLNQLTAEAGARLLLQVLEYPERIPRRPQTL